MDHGAKARGNLKLPGPRRGVTDSARKDFGTVGIRCGLSNSPFVAQAALHVLVENARDQGLIRDALRQCAFLQAAQIA